MLVLWRVVAGVMGVLLVLAGASAGILAGGVLGYFVGVIDIEISPGDGDTYAEICATCWLSVRAGAIAGSVLGILWAVRLWIKALRPVLSSDDAST